MTSPTDKDREAADHYTDIELCGHSIDEEHVHTAFLAGIAHSRQAHAEEVKDLVEALELLEKELLRMTPVYSGLVICIQNSLRKHRARGGE